MLFPILQRLDADAHQARKFALRKSNSLAYKQNVWSRHFKATRRFRLPRGDILRLFKTCNKIIKKRFVRRYNSFTSSRRTAVSLSVRSSLLDSYHCYSPSCSPMGCAG